MVVRSRFCRSLQGDSLIMTDNPVKNYEDTSIDKSLNPGNYNIPSGEELRMMRVMLSLSKASVQRGTGIARTTLRRWEDGENSPTVDNVKRLLAFYEQEYERQKQLFEDAESR